MKEKNERALKEQEQDELLTMSKEEISQVNKSSSSFKTPNTKKVKRSINQNGKNLSTASKSRGSNSSIRRGDLQTRLSSNSRLNRQSTSSYNHSNSSPTRTRTSSRQVIINSPNSSRQSSRLRSPSIRTLNRTL